MKTYIATFWRTNPQLRNRGYETTINIKAETKSAARKEARRIEKSCVYGGLTLTDLQEKGKVT